MTTINLATIRAFFTEDNLKRAQKLSALFPSDKVAAVVCHTTDDDFKVMIDGFTIPGHTSCLYDDFNTKSCPHICFDVATMFATRPSIKEARRPDSDTIVNPNPPEQDPPSQGRSTPHSQSLTCQEDRKLAKSILDRVGRRQGNH